MYKSDEIVQWGAERGIYTDSTMMHQFAKAMEEVGELFAAVASNDAEEVCDAVGDVYVCLVHVLQFIDLTHDVPTPYVVLYTPESAGSLLSMLGTFITRPSAERARAVISILGSFAIHYNSSLESCVDSAYTQIQSRTGRMVNGRWVKDSAAS